MLALSLSAALLRSSHSLVDRLVGGVYGGSWSHCWTKRRSAHVRFLELTQAFKQLEAREGEVTVPLYAAHGTVDHTTSIAAVKRLLKNSASTDVTLNEVTGASRSRQGPASG